jgi:hypothetical protein
MTSSLHALFLDILNKAAIFYLGSKLLDHDKQYGQFFCFFIFIIIVIVIAMMIVIIGGDNKEKVNHFFFVISNVKPGGLFL